MSRAANVVHFRFYARCRDRTRQISPTRPLPATAAVADALPSTRRACRICRPMLQTRTSFVTFFYRAKLCQRGICCRRVSVRPSQTGIVSKRLDESSWFSARRLPSTYPTLCYKEISVSPKLWLLPSGTLSQTQDLEIFATASRSRCQQNSLSSSTVELVDDFSVYDNRPVVAVG